MAISVAPASPHQARLKTSRFLSAERALLERLMPGLDADLKAIPLDVLEARQNPVIRIDKEAGDQAS